MRALVLVIALALGGSSSVPCTENGSEDCGPSDGPSELPMGMILTGCPGVLWLDDSPVGCLDAARACWTDGES